MSSDYLCPNSINEMQELALIRRGILRDVDESIRYPSDAPDVVPKVGYADASALVTGDIESTDGTLDTGKGASGDVSRLTRLFAKLRKSSPYPALTLDLAQLQKKQ